MADSDVKAKTNKFGAALIGFNTEPAKVRSE